MSDESYQTSGYWFFNRFSVRLVLIILVVSLVPLAVSTYINSQQTQNALDEQTLEIQKEATTRIAQNAQTRSELFKREAKLIHDNPYVQSLVAHRYGNETLSEGIEELERGAGYPQLLGTNDIYRQTHSYFEEVASQNPSIEMIRLFWRDGNVLSGYKFGQEDRNDYVGNTYWFNGTMSRSQTPPETVYVSTINIERTTGGQGQPMIRYAVPFEIDGERVGMIVVNYQAEQITAPVTELQIGDEGYGALLDTDYINSSGTELGRVYVANGKDPFLSFVPSIETIPVPANGSASGQLSYNSEDREWVAYYQRVRFAGGRSYYAVVTQPKAEVTAPAEKIIRNGYILVLLGVPVILFVGVVASRRVSKPIERFAREAREVAQGNLDHTITQARGNSVYELQLMTESAQQMKDELVSAIEYEEIFDSIRDPIFVYGIGENRRMLAVNSSAVETLTYSRSELRSRELSDLTPPDVAGELAGVPDRITDEDPLIFETEFQKRNGETFPVEVNATQITYYGTDAILGVARDISSQKRRQRELESLNTRLQLALEETDTGVWEWEIDTDELFWDDASQQLFGYEPGAFPGTYEAFTDRVHEEDRAEITQRMQTATETGEQYQADFRIQLPGGEQRWIQARGVVDSEQDPHRMLGIYTDVTERKQREQELQAYRAELEHSNEKLEQFAYVASHDLQEPLRMISSYIDILEAELGDDLDEETREYLDFAVDGAERMQAMIDGLLEYSRVQTRADPFEEVAVNDVLSDTLQDLEFKIEEAGAKVSVAELPTVTADRNQLGQVFQNLIKNAIEHGGENTVVEVRATEREDGTEFLVEDNGPGIPEHRREDIFAIFDKGGDSEGTGIGLAVCQQIVERHGGEIWVESTVGEGTTFHFTIPDEPG